MNYSVDNEKIWNKIGENINVPEIERDSFLLNFSDSKLFHINFNKKIAYVSCENIFTKYLIESQYKQNIKKLLNTYTNLDLNIKFITNSEKDKIIEEEKVNTDELIMGDYEVNSGLDNNFTFKNYIVSNRNKMIIQAAQSIVIMPNAAPYNPLIIHGGSGLGKTHILHAIGNEINKKMPHKKVRYINAEDFGNYVVKIMTGKSKDNDIFENIEKFKGEFHSCDILLFDDIQFIGSREKTKEIFFMILNKFITEKKQIIITSDSSPRELKKFEDRIITRFKSGLDLSISPPDIETAKKIIKSKLLNIHLIENDILSEETLEFIATNFSESVRELEGALNNLIFHSINSNLEKISFNDAINILGDIKKIKKVTISQIKKVVCDYYHISVIEMESKSRKKEIMIPRHLAIYLTKELLKFSLSKIGKEFGGKDHTTIMNSIKKIEMQRKLEPLMNTTINNIVRSIKN